MLKRLTAASLAAEAEEETSETAARGQVCL